MHITSDRSKTFNKTNVTVDEAIDFWNNNNEIYDNLIEKALIKLDEHLQVVNPIELGIFKIKLGKSIDKQYKIKAIQVVKDVLSSEDYETCNNFLIE